MPTNPEQASPQRIARNVPIEQFSGLLRNLHAVLIDKGFTPSKAQELISQALAASCPQCSIHMTGSELISLARNPEAPSDNPKLERICQGYCARGGCDSHFYSISCADADGVRWDELWCAALTRFDEEAATASQAGSRIGYTSILEYLIDRYGNWKLAATVALVLGAITVIYLQFRTPSWAIRPPGEQFDATVLIEQQTR